MLDPYFHPAVQDELRCWIADDVRTLNACMGELARGWRINKRFYCMVEAGDNLENVRGANRHACGCADVTCGHELDT